MSSHFIKVDSELTIHYEETGKGNQTVLLIPGWTMSTRVYEHQLSFFESSSDYRFITFDPRAQGLSSKTNGGHFYPQHGKDLHHFIEELKLENFILGGWSFGTLATLAYINQFGSSKLSGFIMLDGPPRASGGDNTREWVTYRYDDADGSNQFYTYGKLEDSMLSNREFAAWLFEDATDKRVQWAIEMTLQTPNSAAALLNASSSFLDYEADLIDLHGKIPLWYMMRESQNTVSNNWSRIHTPSAKIDAFGEHMMFWERSDEFNALLLSFARQCFNPS